MPFGARNDSVVARAPANLTREVYDSIKKVRGVEIRNKELLRSFSNTPHTHGTSLPLLQHP